MKKFYLFSVRGITDRFFCGDIYEALPGDEIWVHGIPLTFAECVEMGKCKAFGTRREAEHYSDCEDVSMEYSNYYAQNAMYEEELFGCEGVDNTLNG